MTRADSPGRDPVAPELQQELAALRGVRKDVTYYPVTKSFSVAGETVGPLDRPFARRGYYRP